MHKPPHPGKFIKEVYVSSNGVTCHALARHLDVSTSKLSRLLRGISSLNADMALRLEKALGTTAESWLAMQRDYGLWDARQRVNLSRVSKIESRTA